MNDIKREATKHYYSKGLKYHGEDLKETATNHEDDRWQFVRIGGQEYPRKCVRTQGDGVLVSAACLESETGERPVEIGVEFVEAKITECEFFYVTDSEGHPIEWRIKR